MAMVCLCHGVNERRIRREIDNGATTIAELARGCQAGSCCEGCHPTLDEMLAERAGSVTSIYVRRRLSLT
jgi:bacterioferritin-associated ferredoxin